jgi:phosphoglycolate phosphatase-like HAD superfamily hydrolase
MVGDSIRDMEAAIAAKVHPIFVHNPTLPENEKLSEELTKIVASFHSIHDWVKHLK